MIDIDTPLAAVLEEPHSDEARLVMADWLEERGQQERSDFIRLQIKLHAMSKQNPGRLSESSSDRYALQAVRDDEEFLSVRRRVMDLLATHGHRWRCDEIGFLENTLYDAGLPGQKHSLTWERGFISRCRWSNMWEWQKRGLQLVRLQPIEWVSVLEKVPLRNHYGHYGHSRPSRYAWFHPDVPSSRQTASERLREYANCTLPVEIFEQLQGGPRSAPKCKWYDRVSDAYAELSSVLVNSARAAVGLPPLVARKP